MRKYIYLLAMSLCMGLIGCGDDEVVPPVTSEVNPNNSGEPDKAKTICPDGNHPHAIDLGLPSGTKWCCCNVGSSTPEGCGGYFAWGETSEEGIYSVDTYAYYNSNTGYVNIGSDIAGTGYDVARVRMGSPWRMPSDEQMEELINNCSRQWTQRKDVNGILVKGRNGGQIFLPAAGFRLGNYLDAADSRGLYCSSSFSPYYDNNGYCLIMCFESGYWWVVSGHRDYGHPVRAVRP